MGMIFYYLREMLTIAVPAALIFCCFWPYRQRALYAMGLQTSVWHEIGLIIFVMCLFGVMTVTLWPVYWINDSPGLWGDIVLLVDRPSLWTNVNLIPFQMLGDYWEDLTRGGGIFTLLNFLGNLAVFIPLGFFPALLFRRANWRRSALVGFGTSTLVEIGQYFLMRTTDVDDIILNTLGALCGYWIYILLKHLWPVWIRRFQVEVRYGGETGDSATA